MKISLNTLKFLNQRAGSAADQTLNDDQLIAKIGAQLGAVEEIVDFGKKFEGAVVAKIMSVHDHPDADRLHICWLDDGGVVQGIPRNEQGQVQVVCGAPNVRAGLLVAWLPPGATVPASVGREPFVLEARPLRGVTSHGMLASPKEMALSDDHDGILEINLDSDEIITPGTSFSAAFHLQDDVVIDIENKMFTHRPDCFGWLGIAREIEGIQQRQYHSPAWYQPSPLFPAVEAPELKLEVRNEIPELVPRYSAIVLSGIELKPSPTWLQVDLARAGLRPINNIVDYTNFYMLLTGQPLHAYDYDKVVACDGGDTATIVVRQPRASERLTLLNGKAIDPRQAAIMIASAQQPIGLGGVMGGADTEVDSQTKNIILESASFDMYSIRRTSMAHGLFSDAVTRFNKGQSPLQTLAVLAKITDDLRRLAGAKVASPLVDNNHLPTATQDRASLYPCVRVDASFINDRLGLALTAESMAALLRNVEFDVSLNDNELAVSAPFWRTDIELREDIVEEVGRLHGFDALPTLLPVRQIKPSLVNPILGHKQAIRTFLAAAGANEVLTYSFIHGKLIDNVGQDKTLAYRLSNALSPDLQYFRLSLTPSLLDKIRLNTKAGYDQFVLFELGKAHVIGEMELASSNVKEVDALSLVFVADNKAAVQFSGAAYFQAKKYLANLLVAFNATGRVSYAALTAADLYGNPWLEQMVAPFEPARSAVLRAADGLIWGVVGEYKATVRRALKLPDYCAGFEIDPTLLLDSSVATAGYRPLARFPEVNQDICLRVASSVTYQTLYDFVWKTVLEHKPADTSAQLSPVDIYQRPEATEQQQITLRLRLESDDRTLTDREVTSLLDTVAAAAAQQYNAARI